MRAEDMVDLGRYPISEVESGMEVGVVDARCHPDKVGLP